jgi:hypothetical protein
MQAKTDGITGVVAFDNSTEFSQLLTALPQECRISMAWGTPDATNGVTLNRLGDKIKIVHMYFADNNDHSAEYATVGQILPLSNFVWRQFPAVATVTNIAGAPQAKIDEYNMEIRYRGVGEAASDAENQWITKLGIPVAVAAVEPTTATVAPVTATTDTTSVPVTATTSVLVPKTPDLMPTTTPTQITTPILPAQHKKTGYLPWALGGIALLILLKR